MHIKPIHHFNQQMSELRAYVHSMRTILKEAEPESESYTNPLLCLVEQAKDIFLDSSIQISSHTHLSNALLFCETIQSFLFLAQHVSLEWLTTVNTLLEKLEGQLQEVVVNNQEKTTPKAEG